jgi:hypothetical protein
MVGPNASFDVRSNFHGFSPFSFLVTFAALLKQAKIRIRIDHAGKKFSSSSVKAVNGR